MLKSLVIENMNCNVLIKSIVAILFAVACGQIVFAQVPRVFVLNGKTLSERKAKMFDKTSPDVTYKESVAKIERDAKKALKIEILSIVSKTAVPPSGDKHDYVSQAPYFWKNPKTPDGLPYIRKDGERNPEIKRFPDHDLLNDMVAAVERLSLAYYFTNNDEYAAKASEILRMWFLDAKTKMNPNLQFAQFVPGVNEGRSFGILETRGMIRVVDSIGLLEGSKSWTKDDQKSLESWFDQYLTWLTKSKNGVEEALAKNNHGTYYDVQLVSFALFVGKKDFAKKWLEGVTKERIAKQIEPDGRMPLELERTKSWNYSTMNLEGFVTLAELSENVGIDLFNFQTKDGRGIRKAIEFLYPFSNADSKWKYDQIEERKPEALFPIMRRAARKYKDEAFVKMMTSVPKLDASDKNFLLDK
jgi:Alginate lyase